MKAKLLQEKQEETIYELDKQIQILYQSQKDALQRMLDCNPNNTKTVEIPPPKLLSQMEKDNMALYASLYKKNINNNNINNTNTNSDPFAKQQASSSSKPKNVSTNPDQSANHVHATNTNTNTNDTSGTNEINKLAVMKRELDFDLVCSSRCSTNSTPSETSVAECSSSRMICDAARENTINGNTIYCQNKHCQSNNKAFWDKGIDDSDDKLAEKESKALFGALKQ